MLLFQLYRKLSSYKLLVLCENSGKFGYNSQHAYSVQIIKTMQSLHPQIPLMWVTCQCEYTMERALLPIATRSLVWKKTLIVEPY